MLRLSQLLAALTTITTLSACKDEVEIRYTEFKVPHISAESYHSLGFGIGYAQAEENLCTLAEQLLKLKGEKSRYFGPGPQQMNILSDFGYKILDYPGLAQQYFSELEPDVRDLITGYTAGFNHQLSILTPEHYPTPCQHADWVTAITPTELLAYHLDLAALASSRNLLLPMALAQPPIGEQNQQDLPELNAEQVFTGKGLGSNGWVLGAEKTAGASAALLANPHFPWDGELRFFQQHLTIPGELDVTGVSLIGFPVVLIGFNQHLGWTHTVSQSKQFTFYQLELDPQNPLRYRYGDTYRELSSQHVTISVRQADDSVQQVERTFYRSHYGPMLNLGMLSGQLGWTAQSAITFRDANAGNFRMVQQWLAMGKASSAEALIDTLQQHQGIPWVNTLITGKDGNVHYVDASQVPRLHPIAEGYWRQASSSAQLAGIWQGGDGAVLLPGSEPIFEWQDSGLTLLPGLVPLQDAPQLSRQDYLFNANSSHWLGNLDQPLEGFSLMYGPERAELSPRSRYSAQLISGTQLAGTDAKFSADELKQVFNHNGSLFSTQFRSALIQRCQAYPMIWLQQDYTDLSEVCQALENWDGQYNLTSKGGHVMREFLAAFRTDQHAALSAELYAVPFSADNPAYTPSGLAELTGDPQQDPILAALGKAAVRLEQAGIAPNASLASIQYLLKATGKPPIAMPGGYSYEGVFNMAEGGQFSRSTSALANNVTGLARADSPLLTHELDGMARQAYTLNSGSSFVMVLQFTDQGPLADMLHSYSQSHDPLSPHFSDQTLLYSKQQWQPMRFQRHDVKRHTKQLLRFRLQTPDTND